jgi:hypothetical protein
LTDLPPLTPSTIKKQPSNVMGSLQFSSLEKETTRSPVVDTVPVNPLLHSPLTPITRIAPESQNMNESGQDKLENEALNECNKEHQYFTRTRTHKASIEGKQEQCCPIEQIQRGSDLPETNEAVFTSLDDTTPMTTDSNVVVADYDEPWITDERSQSRRNSHTELHSASQQSVALHKREEKYPRDRCIIITQAPEPISETPSQRMEADCQFLQSCISKLFDAREPGISIVTAFRLGKRRDNPKDNPRPLKVVLETKDDIERIFRRTHRLRGESFYLMRDLSPEDRVKMKEALTILKSRKEAGETDLHIVDFHVVQKLSLIHI